MALRGKKYIILFLLPTLLLIAIFIYRPLLGTTYGSFTNWKGFSIYRKFIGLENYRTLFKDPVVLQAIKNTFILMIFAIIFEVGIALILALLVDNITRGSKFFRITFFFPVVISATAIGLMFSLSYQYDYGLLNNIRTFLGLDKKIWITESSSLALVILPTVWQYVGFYFVIFLTAITKVPTDIYESAMLDGITGVNKARYITIPLIWDVIATSVALVITGTFKAFDIIWVVTKGGPMNSSELLSTYYYSKSFTSQNYGLGSAIGVIMIVLGIILTLISNKLTDREKVIF